jgi:hypothetical protein
VRFRPSPFDGEGLREGCRLVMLLIPGGKGRTESEYRTLFQQAGFSLYRIVATSSEPSVIEGVKI